MKFTGLNIRSGLELDVPIEDIFKVSIIPEGNILAKKYHNSNHTSEKELKDIQETISKDHIVLYDDLKKKHEINNSLDCYEHDSYLLYYDLDNSEHGCPPLIKSTKSTELTFVNTDLLTLDDFCNNLMQAQAFSGNFPPSEFNYQFMGVGDFELSDYTGIHQLAAFSSMNFINFYIKHHILSSIGYFICGLFENDIIEQKKYLTPEQLKYLQNLLKEQKKLVLDSFNSMEGENFNNNDIFFS